MRLRAALVLLSCVDIGGCSFTRDELRILRSAPPEFRFTQFTACGRAILLAWNDTHSETLVLTFDRATVLPTFGEAQFIDLADPRIDVRILIATHDSRPTCGDLISGNPGVAVTWTAAAGRLKLTNARVPRDWLGADHLSYITADFENLKVKGPGGHLVSAPKVVFLAGVAGEGPGP